jgi:hypothetical protein
MEAKVGQIKQNCKEISQLGGQLSNLIKATQQLVIEVPSEQVQLVDALKTIPSVSQTGGRRRRKSSKKASSKKKKSATKKTSSKKKKSAKKTSSKKKSGKRRTKTTTKSLGVVF